MVVILLLGLAFVGLLSCVVKVGVETAGAEEAVIALTLVTLVAALLACVVCASLFR